MVKIRKKTSARQSTRMKHRIEHKVAAAHKKAKKAAKKDVTWKSKAKKDPGIPNLFPYKNQILEEVMQERARKEEAKRAKKQCMQIDAPEPLIDQPEDDAFDTEEEEEDEAEDEPGPSASLKHARSLRSVISSSDILIQVLDARDPLGTRTLSLEKDILSSGKKLLLVLNKIDLVPKENVEAWLKYLRRSFHTLAFRSSTQSQRTHLSTGSKSGPNPANALLALLKNYAHGPAGVKSTTIGVVGLPNVGKSSLINTLKRSKACSVAPTPGWTKDVQLVTLDGGLKIYDCPGVVLSGADVLDVDAIADPLAEIEKLLGKCRKEHLMILYNIPVFNTTQEFLIAVARVRGRLRKGGLPDIQGTARSILRDWNAGRIPYYSLPPPLPSTAISTGAPSVSADLPIQTDSIVSEFAPEFDLDALLKEADQEALEDIKPAKEARGVAITSASLAKEGEVKLMGESEDEPMEEPVEVATSKKRKAPAMTSETVSIQPAAKKKSVAFTDQTAKIFAGDEEMPIAENKAIRGAAKKERRKKARAAKAAMDTSEQVVVQVEPEVSLGLEARTGALSFGDESRGQEGASDSFKAFFGVLDTA